MNRIIIIYLFITTNLFGQTSKESFNQFLNSEQTKTSTVAFQIENLTTGKSETSFNSQKLVYPASLQKLITTSVALDILGKNFKFATKIHLKIQ
mgnify:CR=1 FL=1